MLAVCCKSSDSSLNLFDGNQSELKPFHERSTQVRKINPNELSDDLQQTANILAKLNWKDTKDYKNAD